MMQQHKQQHTIRNLFKVMEGAGLDGFLLLLLSMVGLAYLFPSIGSGDGGFSLKSIANYGISVIFFFYGLRLSPAKLNAGLANWHLHIVIHVATFILFPLLILAIKPLFTGSENILLWLGIFYMATLPSTVSSSVVMVSIARGNIPAAIFNASISSLMGVFITPLWMSLVINDQSGGFDLLHVIIKLIVQIIIPVSIGILLNKRWGAFADKYKKSLRHFDQTIILLIIYTSFCESFESRAFDGFSWVKLTLCSIGMVTLFFVVYYLISFVSKVLGFNREDRITAIFCGSKKSLVHGTVMSKVLFPNFSSLGVILLPIMIYHALQLIIVSIIARRVKTNN